MKLAHAVVGFVDDAVAEKLKEERANKDPIELRAEAGSDAVLMRIERAGVAELRFGPSSKGQTGIQVILKGKPNIETVVSMSSKADEMGLTRFSDPTIKRLLTRAAAFPIYLA